MCSECMTNPCSSRCPNAPEQKEYGTCKYCGDAIIAGEEIATINDDMYHLECVESMDTKTLLRMLDVEVGEVKIEDGEFHVENT